MANITVTDSVFNRLKEIIAAEKASSQRYLRISVSGGGCSGFRYNYDLVTEREEDDIEISKDNLSILIDSVSKDLLDGSVVDFVEDLGFSHFEIKNPNASSKCGCGSSFSV